MKRRWKSNRPNARACAQAAKPSWPEGATAGLLLVAAACLAVSMTLYRVAGPRDAFAETPPTK